MTAQRFNHPLVRTVILSGPPDGRRALPSFIPRSWNQQHKENREMIFVLTATCYSVLIYWSRKYSVNKVTSKHKLMRSMLCQLEQNRQYFITQPQIDNFLWFYCVLNSPSIYNSINEYKNIPSPPTIIIIYLLH